jgi:predicted DNA binding CopG/RHH family protein
MKKKSIAKKMPRLRTDEEAEAFLMRDLSDYLHEGNFSSAKITFVPNSEFEPKSEKLIFACRLLC